MASDEIAVKARAWLQTKYSDDVALVGYVVNPEREADFIDAYTQGRADALRWISVGERLPEKHGLVLCSFCGIVSYGKFNGQVWVVNDEPEASLVKTDIIGFVTHWMPLPIKPRGEND